MQNLWDVAKAVLRGKFIAMLSNSRNKALNRKPNFTPETTGKRKKKIGRRKECIRAEINEK